MASGSIDNSFDTPDLYQPTDTTIKIRKILESENGNGMSIKVISERHNLKYSTVNTCLHRLKDKKLAINKDGLWYATDVEIPSSATSLRDVDTDAGCTHSEVYQVSPTSSAATDLARQLWRHKHFHGLSCHLPDVSSDTVWKKKLGDRLYHLKEKKFWIQCTNDPIEIEEIPEVQAIIKIMLSEIDYAGPIWLNRIENNTDLEGFKLDGAQRIELRSLFGTLYRLYNKQIKDAGYLRAETISEFESGEMTLDGAFYALNLIANSENIHTVNTSLLKKSRHIYNEMANSRQSIGSLKNRIERIMDYIQSGNYDNSVNLEKILETVDDNQYLIQTLKNEHGQKQDLTRDILAAILQGNDIAARQRSQTNQRLGEQINQNELILDDLNDIKELTRQIKEQNINWKQLEDNLKYEVFRELRKQRYTLNDIADFIGYSGRSGAYNWAKRNHPELLELDPEKLNQNAGVDTLVNKSVNIEYQDNASSEVRFTNSIQQFDTLVNKFGIELEKDSEDQQVLKVVTILGSCSSDKVIGILQHLPAANIRRSLSRLKRKKKIFSRPAGANRLEYFTQKKSVPQGTDQKSKTKDKGDENQK